MSVRVRYAPSPTGYQHIGGARTALFNYFFARANGGKFIIRVEDTDRERYFDDALKDLYDTMDWLGLKVDESPVVGGEVGPYTQSERTALYQKYAKELVEKGEAYYCYCSSARLERIRKIQDSSGLPSGYDRNCRSLSDDEIEELKKENANPVIRLKVPLEKKILVHDELLGDIECFGKDISPDPVLLKSDGFPTYHLANIIDDHFMEITHIMRAQEWLPSAPLHRVLYDAFGWDMPKICHLPMVMGNDGHKLSKRHGATSVKDFIAKGYLVEAVVNYISLLGWSYDGEKEFFTIDELCKLFSLEKINKAPAIFDYKKLDWFNGQYIRKLSDDELYSRVLPFLIRENVVPDESKKDFILKIMPLIKERLQYLSDAVPLVKFFFVRPESYNVEDAIPKKMEQAEAKKALLLGRTLIDGFAARSYEANEELFRKTAEENGLKINQLIQGIRVSLTGSTVSPPIFESIELLGDVECLKRIDNLLAVM